MPPQIKNKKVAVVLLILSTGFLVSRIYRSRWQGQGGGGGSRPDVTRAASQKGLEASVLKCKDGDSFVVSWEGKNIEVRLRAVDCPEYDQPFGDEAKKFTEDLVLGREVKIVPRDRDRHGRLVADVYFDEMCLNAELVSNGMAWAFRRYSDDYVKFEDEARAARIGLWSKDAPVPPWEHREMKRSKGNRRDFRGR